MAFADFLGNATTVRLLRESLAAGRLPHTMILAGPRGSGKYTLALMLAQAANCLNPPANSLAPSADRLPSADSLESADGLGPGTVDSALPDFCGVCRNCTRIAAAAPREVRVAEAIAAREELREADKKDTRILIQTHPDVLIVPPDPPQLLIKLGQVRTVIREVYRMPAEARRAFYIFTSSAFMKEAANSLLKVLEEPPAYATLMLLTTNPQELLPTIRSRSAVFTLGALPPAELETLLAVRRPELKSAQRALVARLAQGAVGRALSFPLDDYLAARQEALTLLRTGIHEPDYSALFRLTETYRAGAEGQQKTERLLSAFTGLLEDLLLIQAGQPKLARNVDLEAELARIAQEISFGWIESAARSLVQVESGMRRNLLRSLSLDAFATSLGETVSLT
jgi:DNA polymerase-3 subunit delta'